MIKRRLKPSVTENSKQQTAFKMEIKTLDFLVGLTVGAALGVGLTWLYHRLRAWLGYSEAGRLKSENRSLKRRLGEKDRHISRMIQETERLAERLGQQKVLNQVDKKALD